MNSARSFWRNCKDTTVLQRLSCATGSRLMDVVVAPRLLLEAGGRLRLNAAYYITKQINPAISRVLQLVGADVAAWCAFESLLTAAFAGQGSLRSAADAPLSCGPQLVGADVIAWCGFCQTLALCASIGQRVLHWHCEKM